MFLGLRTTWATIFCTRLQCPLMLPVFSMKCQKRCSVARHGTELDISCNYHLTKEKNNRGSTWLCILIMCQGDVRSLDVVLSPNGDFPWNWNISFEHQFEYGSYSVMQCITDSFVSFCTLRDQYYDIPSRYVSSEDKLYISRERCSALLHNTSCEIFP